MEPRAAVMADGRKCKIISVEWVSDGHQDPNGAWYTSTSLMVVIEDKHGHIEPAYYTDVRFTHPVRDWLVRLATHILARILITIDPRAGLVLEHLENT